MLPVWLFCHLQVCSLVAHPCVATTTRLAGDIPAHQAVNCQFVNFLEKKQKLISKTEH